MGGEHVRGTHTFYLISKGEWPVYPDYMVFALIAGLMRPAPPARYSAAVPSGRKNKPSGAGILWMMPLAGLLTGVGVAVPQVMGNGAPLLKKNFSSKADLAIIPVLLLSFVAKAIVVDDDSFRRFRWQCCSGGHRGGRFWRRDSGLFGCGCSTRIRSACMRCWVHARCLPASQRAPLMAICLVMEWPTLRLTCSLPIGLAVAVARSPFPSGKPLALSIYRRQAADRCLRIAGSQSSHAGRHLRMHQAGLAREACSEYRPVVVGADRHLAPYCCAMCRIDFTPKPFDAGHRASWCWCPRHLSSAAES